MALQRSDRKQYNASLTGDVKPPLLYLTAGQQKFLKLAQGTADSLNPGSPGKVEKCSLKTEDAGSFYVNISASGSVIAYLSPPLAYRSSLLFQIFMDFMMASNYTSVGFGQDFKGRLSQKGSQLPVATT